MTFGEDLFRKPSASGPLQGVPHTAELERILNLPVRPVLPECYQDLSPLYARRSSVRLRSIQNAMLWEAAQVGGLLAPVGVGHGKTLVTLLLPDVLRSERALLLVPAHMVNTLLERELPRYLQDFDIPRLGAITVVSYEELSSPKNDGILDEIKPDLIIADEAHHLRHKATPRWRRIARYLKQYPSTRCCFLSGSITNSSIRDYAHLAEAALHRGSPLPYGYHDLNDWANVIDVGGTGTPGALMLLASRMGVNIDPASVGYDDKHWVRNAFRQRLIKTPGVVTTTESSLSASLTIRGVRPPMSAALSKALEDVRELWATPDEEFTTTVELSAALRQLAHGFYYRWDWPDGQVDEDWLEARSEWNRLVRRFLNSHNVPNMDSPALLERAAASGRWKEGVSTYVRWNMQSHKPTPPTRAVWVDDSVVQFAANWARTREKNHERAIIWYEHEAVGAALEALTGLPRYGAGSGDPAHHEEVILASRAALGTGKNLQAWWWNLVMCPMANGGQWEQLIGRTHRAGQVHDEVFVEVMVHTPELESAWVAATADASYTENTLDGPQKILFANLIDMPRGQ